MEINEIKQAEENLKASTGSLEWDAETSKFLLRWDLYFVCRHLDDSLEIYNITDDNPSEVFDVPLWINDISALLIDGAQFAIDADGYQYSLKSDEDFGHIAFTSEDGWNSDYEQ